MNIETAVKFAESIADDNYHGYSQARRGEQDTDCSKIVIDSLHAAGVDVSGATYTGNMLAPILKAGFKDVADSVNLRTGEGLRRGDVLLRPKTDSKNGHAAFYIGNGQIVQAQADYDGRLGDSSGREIRRQNYYDSPFRYVLRYDDGGCPYAEPTQMYVPRNRFEGNDAFWFQWQLARIGYTIKIDGIAGQITWAKLTYEIGQGQRAGKIQNNVAGKELREYLKGVPTR